MCGRCRRGVDFFLFLTTSSTPSLHVLIDEVKRLLDAGEVFKKNLDFIIKSDAS